MARKHITRKELKKNELAETLTHGAEAVAAHKRLTWILAGGALVVLLAVFGWRYYSQSQTAQAGIELEAAMQVYNARIRAVGEPEVAGEISYIDEKNKYTDAAKKFEELAARYPRTRPGREARYYAALCLVQLQKNDEAEKALKAVESSGDQILAPLAEFQLAQLYEKTNRADQAMQIYQQLADKPAEFVPRAVVLLKMADYQSKTDPAQAAKLYNQVKSEFPDTAAAQAADQGLQLLPPAKT
jgi:predicted negative regulator of RcsB-dependent stress response